MSKDSRQRLCKRDDDTHLGEGDRVDAVLAGDLETNVVAGLRVPGSLGTGLNLGVDLVVV